MPTAAALHPLGDGVAGVDSFLDPASNAESSARAQLADVACTHCWAYFLSKAALCGLPGSLLDPASTSAHFFVRTKVGFFPGDPRKVVRYGVRDKVSASVVGASPTGRDGEGLGNIHELYLGRRISTYTRQLYTAQPPNRLSEIL